MSEDLTREQQLYNMFVDALLEKVKTQSATPKELEIVMKFLDNNNIGADINKHDSLNKLKSAMELPFDDEDESHIRRVK